MLTAQIKKHSLSARGKTRYFKAYSEVDNFLPKWYATNEIIAESKSDITPFAQPSLVTPSQNAAELVASKLW